MDNMWRYTQYIKRFDMKYQCRIGEWGVTNTLCFSANLSVVDKVWTSSTSKS